MNLLIGALGSGSLFVPSSDGITLSSFTNVSVVRSLTVTPASAGITLSMFANTSTVHSPVLALGPPENITLDLLPRAIRVRCDMVTGRSDHAGYEIWRGVNAGALTKLADMRYHVYEDTSVVVGSTYEYQLRSKFETVLNNDWFRAVNATLLSGFTGSVSAVAVDADVEYWVNPDTGLDTNDGSVLNPFKTLQKAADMAHTNREADQSTYINAVATKRFRPDITQTLYAAKGESANNSGELAGLIRMVTAPTAGKDDYIVFDLGQGAILDGSTPFLGTWTDRTGDLGADVWSAPWNYKFGYKAIQADDQGAMAVARDQLYINDLFLRPCKAARTYSFTLPLMTAPAALTQESIVVSTGTNAPYQGQPDGAGGNYLDLGTWEFFVTDGTNNEWILVRQHNTLGTLEVTRGRRSTTPFAWPNGTAVTYSGNDPGANFNQAYCIANVDTFYVDEENAEVLIHTTLNPNSETIDTAVCRELIRFQSGAGKHVTFRGAGTGATVQRSIDFFNDGSSATLFVADSDRFWITGIINWKRCNYTAINVAGDQAQAPTSAINWHVLLTNTFSDCGGQSYAAFRCRDLIQDANIDDRSNWRGALGNWYKWNTGNKTSNECHRVYHVNNIHRDCKGDNHWFDLDGEDVVIEGNSFFDAFRYGGFFEALRGSAGREIIVRRNRFVGNGSSALAAVEDAKGSVDINNTSSHVLFEDNYLDGLGVCDRMIRLSGDDKRWTETHWNDESPFYLHQQALLGYGVPADSVTMAGNHLSKFPNASKYHGIVISGSTNNDSSLLADNTHTLSTAPVIDGGSNTEIVVNETINTAVVDGVISSSYNFIPHSWTFRRNLVRGYLDALWAYQFVNTTTAGGFFETLDTDYNLFQLTATNGFPDPDVTEDSRVDHATFKAMLATKGAPGGRDANTKLINLGTIADPKVSTIFTDIENNVRPATPPVLTGLAINSQALVSWDEVTGFRLNSKDVDVSVSETIGGTVIVGTVLAGTSTLQLVEGTDFDYGTLYYLKIRETNTSDVDGPWTAETPFIMNQPITKLVPTGAAQGTGSASGTISLNAQATTLLILVAAEAGSGNPITDVSYNSSSLTQVSGALATRDFQVSVSAYLLDAPTIGTNLPFSATSNQGTGEVFVWVYELRQALAGSEIDIVAVGDQGTGSTSQSLSPVANWTEGLIIDIVAHTSITALTEGANQTVPLTATLGDKIAGTSCRQLTTAGAYTVSWTSADNTAWAHVAVVLRNTSTRGITVPHITNVSDVRATTISANKSELVLTSISNTSTVQNVTLTAGAVSGLSLTMFSNTSSVPNPTIGAVPAGLTLTMFTNTSTVPNPTLAIGSAGISLTMFSNSSTVPNPTIGPAPAGLTLTMFSNSSTVPNPTLTVAANSLSLTMFTNTSTVPSPTLGPSPAGLTLTMFTNTSSVPNPTLTVAAGVLSLTMFSNTSTVPSPTLGPSPAGLALTMFTNTSSVPNQAIAAQPAGLTLTMFTNTSTVQNVTIAAASSLITGPNDSNWGGNGTLGEFWLSDQLAYNDAGTTLATDGQSVQEWHSMKTSSSAKFSQITSGNRPLWEDNEVNTVEPVVRFDGVDDFVTLGAAAPTNAAITWFWVIKEAAGQTLGDGNRVWSLHNSCSILWDTTTGVWQYRRNQASTEVAITGATSALHVLTFRFNSASSLEMKVDDGVWQTAEDPNNNYDNGADVWLAVNINETQDCDIDYCSIGWCTSALSDTDVDDMVDFLMDKYGIV